MMCEKKAVFVQRILCFLLFVALALSLFACGNMNIETMAPESVESEDEALSDEKAISENRDGQKILVTYFSWADNAERDNINTVTMPGNVAQLTSYITGKYWRFSHLY